MIVVLIIVVFLMLLGFVLAAILGALLEDIWLKSEGGLKWIKSERMFYPLYLHDPYNDCVPKRKYDDLVRIRYNNDSARPIRQLTVGYDKYGSAQAMQDELNRLETEQDMGKVTLSSLDCKVQCGYVEGHRINVSAVFTYLTKNPTLDEGKSALRFGGGTCVMDRDYNGGYRDDYYERQYGKRTDHRVPMDKLREFIMSVPELRLVYEATTPSTITVTETVYVESALALSPEERAEMVVALQRQQHIRNEYIRRAYIALEKSTKTGNEDVYRKELDTQLTGMATLRSLMERLDIPMADWMDKDTALAQLPVILDAEATHERQRVSALAAKGGH